MFNYMLIRSHLCHNYWMLIYCIIGSTLLYWAYLVCFCIYCASSAHTHPHLCIQIVLNKIGYELFCCSYTLLELYSAIYFLFFRTVIWKYADVIRILIDTHVCDHTDRVCDHTDRQIFMYTSYIYCVPIIMFTSCVLAKYLIENFGVLLWLAWALTKNWECESI